MEWTNFRNYNHFALLLEMFQHVLAPSLAYTALAQSQLRSLLALHLKTFATCGFLGAPYGFTVCDFGQVIHFVQIATP